MTGIAAKTAKGRPVDGQKTLQVFAAIDSILEEQGIARLSIERIAKTAGISKVTLYRRFDTLQGVIGAYVETFTSEAMALDSLEAAPRPSSVEQMEAELNRLGVRLMELISQPRVMAFDNAIAAGGPQYQALKEQLYSQGPGRAMRHIASLFEHSGVHHPEVGTNDLAEMLFLMWQSGFYPRLKFLGATTLEPSQLSQHVAVRTRIFLSSIQS
ncbi:TetR/AcrR family transcriptional regulator [Ferrimonas sp.]|uniref:TetR/AcrR family transcriptional regulator n=1 Tax=Ferrimonas sp. TaxID=2080861 RepID=UPI003A8F75F2